MIKNMHRATLKRIGIGFECPHCHLVNSSPWDGNKVDGATQWPKFSVVHCWSCLNQVDVENPWSTLGVTLGVNS